MISPACAKCKVKKRKTAVRIHQRSTALESEVSSAGRNHTHHIKIRDWGPPVAATPLSLSASAAGTRFSFDEDVLVEVGLGVNSHVEPLPEFDFHAIFDSETNLSRATGAINSHCTIR
jgi:hypothetical protein